MIARRRYAVVNASTISCVLIKLARLATTFALPENRQNDSDYS